MRYFLFVLSLLFSGSAYACNVPNPNLNAPPFVDGCDVPAVALNRISSGGGGNISGMTSGQLGVANGASSINSSFPFGLTGNNTIVETTASGLLTPSILPLATSSAFGAAKVDGITITANNGMITAPTVTSLVNVKSSPYGAICDGGSHPLSGHFSTLAAAQAVYPFITSLTQQIDYAALKLASNTAFGADGSEHAQTSPQLNRPLYIPSGNCFLGNDEWLIRSLSGGQIFGDASQGSTVSGNGIVLGFDGLWYSNIHDLNITSLTNSNAAALDVDGNVPGHPYATFSVQGNNFTNMFVNGGGSSTALSMCRLGGNGAQCSENIFTNLHANGASFAVYYQNGSNAVNNMMLEGDLQNFAENGIYLNSGSLSIYRMSFESEFGYNQVLTGNCDIHANSGGVGDAIIVHGNRTQDMCFYLGGSSQPADIRGVSQNLALNPWSATTGFALSTITKQIAVDTFPRIYAVTTPGTSGGSPPTWPNSGTVTDGSVVWTEINYTAILAFGNVDYATTSVDTTASISMRNTGTGLLAQIGYDAPAFQLADPIAGNGVAEVGLNNKVTLFNNPNSSAKPGPVSAASLPGSAKGIAAGASGNGLGLYSGNGILMYERSSAYQVTFATLPGCSGWQGYEVYVSDATDPGRGNTVAAGSGGGVKAICNGTHWVAE